MTDRDLLACAITLALVACHAPPSAPEPSVHGAAPLSAAAGSEAPRVEADDPDGVESEEGTEGLEAAFDPVSPANVSPAAGLLALEALRELSLMRASRYSHRTRVDEAEGTFDFDCSGLVGYALARAAPDALVALQRATVKRPLAKHFVSFLASLPAGGEGRWRRVARATDLAPGDLIAWLKPDDVSSKNTGHVMIVREAAPLSAPAAGVVFVAVIDSTSVRHGASDSRSRMHASGLGEGTIGLVLDAEGAPVGYQWSRGSRARTHATTIALGRLD